MALKEKNNKKTRVFIKNIDSVIKIHYTISEQKYWFLIINKTINMIFKVHIDKFFTIKVRLKRNKCLELII